MTFPANYAVIAEDELTYVTGGGVIANVLPAIMTSENWKTFNTNLVKIVGNTFMSRLINAVLGTTFGTSAAFGSVADALNTAFSASDLPNTLLQVAGGAAAIYTLGTAGAKTVQEDKVVGSTGVAL